MTAAGLPAGGRGALAAAAFAAVFLFGFLGAREVRNPDEPREAEVAREFAADGMGAVPRLDGRPFLEKPPLFHWSMAAGFEAAGGPSDLLARAVPALFGVAAALATFALGETLLGPGRGLLAALLFAGTPFVLTRFRTCTTDTALTAFTTLSLACFFRGWKTGSWRWAALAGPAAGLAFLSKGYLGFGIPALVAGAFLAARRDLRGFLRLHLWIPVLLGLAVAAPWLLALHRGVGTDGLREMFLEGQIGKRFSGNADHGKSPLYYFALAAYALPWTPLLVAGGAAVFRPGKEERERLLGPLAWFAALFLLFSLVPGKRALYLLPLYPAVALLAAGAVDAAERGVLGPRLDATVRWTLRLAALPLLVIPAVRRCGPARQACAAAALFAAGAVVHDAAFEARTNDTDSARVLAARAEVVAAGRPLVLFRVGEGDVGQFAWALRRVVPSAWNERQLREAAAGRPVLVLTQEKKVLAAVAEGPEKGLAPGTFQGLRFVEKGTAGGDEYGLYEWDGR